MRKNKITIFSVLTAILLLPTTGLEVAAVNPEIDLGDMETIVDDFDPSEAHCYPDAGLTWDSSEGVWTLDVDEPDRYVHFWVRCYWVDNHPGAPGSDTGYHHYFITVAWFDSSNNFIDDANYPLTVYTKAGQSGNQEIGITFPEDPSDPDVSAGDTILIAISCECDRIPSGSYDWDDYRVKVSIV